MLTTACASVPVIPQEGKFPVPPPPDYRQAGNWAALPTTDDYADRTPADSILDRQAIARADVFFIHPTIYAGTRKHNKLWNASLKDDKLNESVDKSTILNQASIFNGAGKVYAPRYRQANLSVFYDNGAAVKTQALDTAYADVLAAFDHYLTHFNHGRPIIIAAHSQGTLHAIRLLADRFVGQALHQQLIVAYLVGMPVRKREFADIPVCTDPEQTGCFVSWRTYREDYVPDPERNDTSIAVVNPLSWTTATTRAPSSLNRGGVLYNFDGGPIPGLVWAEIRGAFLYTNKPSFFGDIFFRSQNYHVADYNFFWSNVRHNAGARVQCYLRKQ
ncbi:hypothetical protein GGR28_002777 [Lewinella aquimaris]|uniref:DUF3089 domain-containing protein n=1 Tax=Neolewinella aquimaris TaxID=1835722 RepID=A0A840E9V8_9BACT|nr:DUF3089 domain-containing protein [Neolewinella aquimaris]MBB4080147.1 hypothetical protein [Neolewinella aquimaris]